MVGKGGGDRKQQREEFQKLTEESEGTTQSLKSNDEARKAILIVPQDFCQRCPTELAMRAILALGTGGRRS